MLSIGKISPGQASYYERSVAQGADDYYSGDGEAPGTWAGRGSQALGLSGRVQAERFNALIAGKDPSDPQLRRTLLSQERKPRIINGKRHEPVAAYDLTFSAPKSVSVLFATADPDTARELVRAHDRAVTAALEYIEDRAVYTRRGRNGAVIEQGDGLIAAAYRHRMSRSKDPQLHTHVVAGNLVRTPSDGKWRAVHAAVVYRHARTAGVLYQSHLRAEIDERLGLRWGPVTKGAAEIQGVPRAVLREFSRRRIEIEEAAAADGIGLDTKAGAEALALKTRTVKDETVPTADWRADVAARAQEHGFDRDALTELLADGRTHLETPTDLPDSHPAPDFDALAEHLTGPAGLTELQNTFAERDTLSAIAELHPQGLRVAETRAVADQLIARDDVLDTKAGVFAGVPEDRHSTTDLVACERRLVEAAVGRIATDVAVASDETVDRAIRSAARAPSADQETVIRAVARSGNGVDVVEALAGTGKTFTAGILGTAYALDERPVIGVAPTGRAARELTDVGIPARTIDSVLLSAEHHRGPPALPTRCVVILDEAGMAPTRRTARFLELAQAAGAKVIAFGDSGQLPSVHAGGWLRQIGKETGAPKLTQVLRQRDAEERRVLGLLHDQKTGGDAYVEWLGGQGRLHVSLDSPGLMAQAVAAWADAADTHGMHNAVLIARDNGTRDALNDRARRHHGAAGGLGEEQTYGDRTIAVGDRVIARRNDRHLGIDNGTRGIVTDTHADWIELRTDSGHRQKLPSAYVADHVEHAYALTGHGMQGATVEWAGVVARPEHLTKGWAYTALSRARDATHLYVPAIDHERAEDRAELAPHDTITLPDHRETMFAIRMRMRDRDDEDLAVTQLVERELRTQDLRDLEGTPDEGDDETRKDFPAEQAEPRTRETSPQRLVRLTEHLSELERQSRPAIDRLLDRLDDLSDQRVAARKRLDVTTQQLEAIPEPQPRRFRRAEDPHAADRATATAKVTATREHLDTLDRRIEEGTRQLGGGVEIARAECRLHASSIAETARARVATREAIVAHVVELRPPWTGQILGPTPTDEPRMNTWNEKLADVVRATLDRDPKAASELIHDDFDPGAGDTVTRVAQAVAGARPVRAHDEPDVSHPDLAP